MDVDSGWLARLAAPAVWRRLQGGATGAEADAEPSGRQWPGHGGGVAGDGAALPPGRHPKHGGG